jgi:glycosyltransferase involved in cell wall biosynthesis
MLSPVAEVPPEEGPLDGGEAGFMLPPYMAAARKRHHVARFQFVRAIPNDQPGRKSRTGRARVTGREEDREAPHELQSSGAPWLSILIPVYNVEAFLRLCVNSILPQLPSEGVEVILLNDASTDRSYDICVAIERDHPDIVRLMSHEENRGLSAARNTMLEAARGDYVWFVDSDDELLPGAVAGLRLVLDRCSPELILCGYRKQGKDFASFDGPQRVLSTDREGLVRGVFSSRRMHSWTKIARRSLWGDDLRFPVGRCFEDAATTPWLLLRARSFYYTPEPWVMYRVRPGSITGAVSRTRGRFDDAKNDDLAVALVGFAEDARRELPGMSPETRYSIGQFCAKEFTKIVWRLLSARLMKDDLTTILNKARRYRRMMEGCSPTPFRSLAAEHLRRGKPGRFLVLGLFLLLTRRSGTSVQGSG